MSSTPVEHFQARGTHSPPESPCQECQRSRMDSSSGSEQNDSSSSQGSESISIHLKAEGVKEHAIMLASLEGEIAQLRAENRLLSRQNKELLRDANVRGSQKQLQRDLKLKEREILQLKNQLNLQSQFSSPSKIHYNSISRPILQHSDYPLVTPSQQKTSRKSVEPSNQPFEFDDAKFRRKQWEIEKKRWAQDRADLERQLAQLCAQVARIEAEGRWALRLAASLVSLSQKLGWVFKERVCQANWGLRRQAKASWRYLKHLLGYFLVIDG